MPTKNWTKEVLAGLQDAIQMSAVSMLAPGLAVELINAVAGALKVRSSGSQTARSPVDTLAAIKTDLEGALGAIEALEGTAKAAEQRAVELRQQIDSLSEDRHAAEQLLGTKKEAVERLIGSALSRGRARGWLEGLVVGTLGSLVASVVWHYFTKS